MLNSDKVLSQQSANVPNAVEDSSCLMQADKNFMYIGEQFALAEFGSCFRNQEVHLNQCSAVFVAKDYPERTAFELVRQVRFVVLFPSARHQVAQPPQVRKEFNDKEAAGAASATENSLSKSCKKWMSAACAKYDDVTSINKVAEVQAKVDPSPYSIADVAIDRPIYFRWTMSR